MSDEEVDKDKPKVPTNPVAMKQYFMENAAPLLEEYLKAAKGEGILTSADGDSRDEVWALLKQFITKADEKLELPEELRGSPEGVLTAVEKGMITLEEGERLLNMHLVIKKAEALLLIPGGNTHNTLIPSLTINTNPVMIGGDDGAGEDT